MAQIKGEIIQVIGPVIDVSFEKSGKDLPNIHDALEIKKQDGTILIIECQQHIGENTPRALRAPTDPPSRFPRGTNS